MQTSILFNAFAFTIGFWWICYQIGIGFPKVFRSLAGGFLLGFAGVYGFKHHLSLLPVAGLLTATLLLWLQAREQLAQKISRDSVYLLTLTFIYFCSPWQGAFRWIGLVAAVPCLLVLLYCLGKKNIDPAGRVGLMFWTMLVSLVIGIQQIWSAPEALAPAKNVAVGISSGSPLLLAALQAAGLVTLAFSLVPFIDWARGAILGHPHEVGHEMMNDPFSAKRAFALAFIHVLPMLLNWKFHFCSYDTMLGYALVWSPILSSSFADALEPEPLAEIPGWDNDATRAS